MAHVSEDWKVDSEGNWLETLDGGETIAKPNPGNSWVCYYCGVSAEVE